MKREKNKQLKPKAATNIRYLSHLDGTEKVLEEEGKEEAMHYEKIAEIAINKRWIKSSAISPARSIYNAVYADIKKGNSRFLLDNRTGRISLAKWEGRQVISKIEEHNEKTKKKLLDLLKKMNPAQFEKFIAEVLLPGIGFEDCYATQVTKDEGIDARGRLSIMDAVYINVGVQIKRWNSQVSSPEIRTFRGSLKPHEQGLFITTGYFTTNARKEAIKKEASHIINLIDGGKLVDILTTMDWSAEERGVRIEKRNLIILDEMYFKNYGD